MFDSKAKSREGERIESLLPEAISTTASARAARAEAGETSPGRLPSWIPAGRAAFALVAFLAVLEALVIVALLTLGGVSAEPAQTPQTPQGPRDPAPAALEAPAEAPVEEEAGDPQPAQDDPSGIEGEAATEAGTEDPSPNGGTGQEASGDDPGGDGTPAVGTQEAQPAEAPPEVEPTPVADDDSPDDGAPAGPDRRGRRAQR